MSEQNKAAPRARSALAALNDKIAAEVPEYGPALAREKALAERSRAVRDLIRAKRLEAGLRQDQMAALLGITQSAVSKIEASNGDIGLQTLFRFGDVLGLELHVGPSEHPAPLTVGLPHARPSPFETQQEWQQRVYEQFAEVVPEHRKDARAYVELTTFERQLVTLLVADIPLHHLAASTGFPEAFVRNSLEKALRKLSAKAGEAMRVAYRSVAMSNEPVFAGTVEIGGSADQYVFQTEAPDHDDLIAGLKTFSPQPAPFAPLKPKTR